MQDEGGFRVVIDRQLLAEMGNLEVDYLTGPLRRGFSIKTAGQPSCC